MKKIAIMQPYFFPYLGYFSLIKHTDEFIIFDTVQFIRHGWIERNRILKQNDGWLYIKVPLVKHDRGTLIKDVHIDTSKDWKKIILAQLKPYKKIAPFYNETRSLVEGALGTDTDSIVELDRRCMSAVCDYLGINKPIAVFSEMELDIEEAKAPDEWALNICKALNGVDEYWNPPGGQSFFDKSKYDSAGIKLQYQLVELDFYDQKRDRFEPGLSIIDVLMFNNKEETNALLDKYKLL